ncbi:DUF1573 domain-containing protein, partial [Rubripirellula amarantea]|nr:DUF1573 domain-containing protein [Rubripirellula amarantea]
LALVISVINSGCGVATTESLFGVDELVTLSPQRHDFGLVRPGKPVTHNFVITNVSGKAIHLQDVQGGCGCIRIVSFPSELLAAQSGDVVIQLVPGNEYGEISKNVLLLFADDYTRVLQVEAMVAGLWSAPQVVDFGEIDRVSEQVVTVYLSSDKVISDIAGTADSPFEVKAIKEHIGLGSASSAQYSQAFQITLLCAEGAWPSGQCRGQLKVMSPGEFPEGITIELLARRRP